MTPNVKGALLMTGSMASFTLNDTLVKLLADDVPLFQIVFLRGLLTTILLAIVVAAFGRLNFRIPKGDRGKVALRTLFEMGAMVAFLVALVNMAIANVTALLSAMPLMVTVGAAILFHEPVGWRRISAICVGLVGVMMIVQPGTEGFNAYSLLALLSAVMVAGRDLATRSFSLGVPTLTVAVITAGAVGLFGGLLSLTEPWVAMPLREIALLAASSVCIIGGYIFSILVMRVGDVSATAPFRYTALVFALILGVVIFDELPNTLALCGAAVVMATGVFTLIRERRVKHG